MKKNNFKDQRKNIALNRIHHLFKIILETKDKELCKRYIILARKLSTKYNTPIPRVYKRLFCKKCNSLYNFSNTKVRTKNCKLIYTCFVCKEIHRYKFN